MNVMDSSGWIEYFADGPNANFFEGTILNTRELIVPSICIFEVFKCLSATHGEEKALSAVAVMSMGWEAVLERETAIAAAEVSLEYKLAMADSIILATARLHNAILWTQDRHFKEIPDVKYIQKAGIN